MQRDAPRAIVNAAANPRARAVPDARRLAQYMYTASGMAKVHEAKRAHFEGRSGFSRTIGELDAISDVAYRVRRTYDTAEELFRMWAEARVPADHAVLYIWAGVSVDEALRNWEPRFRNSPDETRAALAVIGGLAEGRSGAEASNNQH